MRVAFVTQPLSRVRPHAQGNAISIWIDQVARRLARSCDVSVFSPRYREDPPVETCENVEYCAIRTRIDHRLSRWTRFIHDFRRAELPYYASMSHYAVYAYRAAMAARERQCDVIHVMNFPQFARVIRAVDPRVRIVLHMHCEWLNTLDYRSMSKCVRAVDGILACSDFVIQRVRERFPWFEGHLSPLLNGVDTDVFTPRDSSAQTKDADEQTILYVGRLSPEKGVHVLLDAFCRVQARRPRSRLELIGAHGSAPPEFIIALSNDPKVTGLRRFYNGEYRTYLEQRLPSNLTRRASFVGKLPHTELVERYRNASLFIFPSVWDEPFGMPIIEAMACGVPVVATRGGGIPELVVDGVTGLLVDRDDPEGLAKAILTLLEDEPLRRIMGATGRQRAAELFSWDRIAETVLKHYQALDRSAVRANGQ